MEEGVSEGTGGEIERGGDVLLEHAGPHVAGCMTSGMVKHACMIILPLAVTPVTLSYCADHGQCSFPGLTRGVWCLYTS